MNTNIRNTILIVGLLVATPLISACAGAGQSAGSYIDDAAITAKVKNQLLQAEEVSGLRVNVETFQGRVQLSGFVSSDQEKKTAEQLARKVPGVKGVSNDLIVRAEGSR